MTCKSLFLALRDGITLPNLSKKQKPKNQQKSYYTSNSYYNSHLAV